MHITPSRILIFSAFVSLVAVMLPGARHYFFDEACLGTAILTTSGGICPNGSERLPIAAVQWFQVPTLTSTLTALLVGLVVILAFTLRDRAKTARIAV